MKPTIYHLAAVLTVLTLAACGKDEKKEPPYEPPPYRPVTMSFENESLEEVQEAIKGKWIWHSCTYYEASLWDPESEEFIPSQMQLTPSFVSFMFDGMCFTFDYETKDNYPPIIGGRETFCDLKWSSLGYYCRAFHYSDLQSYREFQFQQIQKDTLFMKLRGYIHDRQDVSEYLKLTKQH